MTNATEPIPNQFHFVWFGEAFPCFAMLAVRSALRRNPGAHAILWHGPELSRSPHVESLAREGLVPRPIDIESLLQSASSRAPAALRDATLSRLASIYQRLKSPAARSNLVRLLVLFAEGGVYLDTDTLSLVDLGELRRARGFCGLEHVLWPKKRLDKTRPYFWTQGPLLEGLRQLGKWLPEGHALYRHSLRWYSEAVNNAVLGFTAGHPLLLEALSRIADMDRSEFTKRFRLGTHLLQDVLQTELEDPTDLRLLEPEYFYPLGPIISAHYFKKRRDARMTARQLLGSRTHVVHWYSSVSDLLPLDEAYIRANAEHSVYAHLCAPLLD